MVLNLQEKVAVCDFDIFVVKVGKPPIYRVFNIFDMDDMDSGSLNLFDASVTEVFNKAWDPEDYDEDSPERESVDFLTFWGQNNYGGMANSLITRDGGTEHPGDISEEFDHIDLKAFELVEINDVGAARTDITVRVKVDRLGETVEDEASVTLIRMGDDGRAAISGHEDGTWTVTNRMVLKSL